MHCYVDTSAFYAFLVSGDRYHVPVKEYLKRSLKEGIHLFSSSFVLSEILGLLQIRHGVDAARRFMMDVYPVVQWRWVDSKMYQEIWKLVISEKKRSFTVVDASAVVCVRDRPGSVCLAVDADLERFDFEVVPQ